MAETGATANARPTSGLGTALVLVRNPVTHDARVLREAAVLRELGFDVLVAGVVSTAQLERRLQIGDADIVRLDPAAGIRRLAGWIRARRPTPVGEEGVAAGGSIAAAGGSIAAAGGSIAAAAGPPPRRDAGAAGGRGLRSRFQRLAMTAAYYRGAIALARATAPRLVHANDYNTMWIGIAAKLLCRSRLLYDCHELWPDRNGRPEWRPWLLACEALFVRVADATITTSPGYAEAIADRYRVRPPLLVRNIPTKRVLLEGGAARSASGNGGVLGVYIGGLMPGRGLEQAIQALALAPRTRLRFIGPGNESYRQSLARCAEHAGVADRVELALPVAPERVLDAIAGADIGLMLIQPACRSYELTLPNKLFEYAAAGVPILSSDLPVIGAVVREEGLGDVVAPDDIGSIAAALRRLAEPAVNRERRERVRAFGQRETWERERAKLERVYLDLVGESRSTP